MSPATMDGTRVRLEFVTPAFIRFKERSLPKPGN